MRRSRAPDRALQRARDDDLAPVPVRAASEAQCRYQASEQHRFEHDDLRPLQRALRVDRDHLIRGERHRRSFQAEQVRGGLLAQLDPKGRQLAQLSQGALRVPGAVGVQPQADRGAGRVADHGRPRVVAVETHLQLEDAESLRPGALGLARQLRNALRREQRARRNFQRRSTLEQAGERNAGALRVEIEQRLLHRAAGCRSLG